MLFNLLVARFLTAVKHGQWGILDARSLSSSTTGAK
jgi:hypothetical protein